MNLYEDYFVENLEISKWLGNLCSEFWENLNIWQLIYVSYFLT